MKKGNKKLTTFCQNSNKLKDEGNLGNHFEDQNTAGDQKSCHLKTQKIPLLGE